MKSLDKIPLHIAIIPDGNRRWAKKKGLAGYFGHKKSGEYENIYKLAEEAYSLGARYVSVWGFSSENWKRSEEEKKIIFDLIYLIVKKFRKDSFKNQICFRWIGRRDRIPEFLRKELEFLEKETRSFDKLNVQFCLDYGGRDEIVRAVNKILKDQKLKIDEKEFEDYLDSKNIPDIDLIIRTSGEERLSGFMPWQSVYSELIFLKKNFPDFNVTDLRKCFKLFSKRKRRFGS